MVAFVRDEREANYLRVKIAFERLREIDERIQTLWSLRPKRVFPHRQWLAQFSELSALATTANRKMAAAVRDFCQEMESL